MEGNYCIACFHSTTSPIKSGENEVSSFLFVFTLCSFSNPSEFKFNVIKRRLETIKIKLFVPC